MKPKLRFVSVGILIVLSILGCNAAGPGTTEGGPPNPQGPTVLAGGFCRNSSGFSAPGYWRNGIWTNLPTLSAYDSQVTAVFVSGNDIYAAGWS